MALDSSASTTAESNAEISFTYPAALCQELIRGLRATPATISPKFLYDDLGSALFGAITQLPEYYPTRTESDILSSYRSQIARCIGRVDALIDLGAGDCSKGEALMSTLCPTQYVPIDISENYLALAVRRLATSYPELDIVPLGQDFSHHLQLPARVLSRRRLFFYPGSSIGNFTPQGAKQLLQRIYELAHPDGALLIGVDCPKPLSALLTAYNDPLQVTAAFNRNILRHVNRVLHSDFDIDQWKHQAQFNQEQSRIEMHLVANTDLIVKWPGGERRFLAGETIHTENSYKYCPETFERLLLTAGFKDIQHWTDAQGWFAVYVAKTHV